MYFLTVKEKFDAAHFLPNYPGDCANMHGHTWLVEATWVILNLNSIGISIDFKDLKTALKDVCDKFDHKIINQTLPVPTAELIAKYIFEALCDESVVAYEYLQSVCIHETDTSKVVYALSEQELDGTVDDDNE